MTPTEKLLKLAESLTWLPIEGAPKIGEPFLGAIQQPDGSFGEPFHAYWDCDDGFVCLFQTEVVKHVPTHFMPLPSGKAGEVIRILVEGLQTYKEISDEAVKFLAGFSATPDMEDTTSLAYKTLQRAAEAIGDL